MRALLGYRLKAMASRCGEETSGEATLLWYRLYNPRTDPGTALLSAVADSRRPPAPNKHKCDSALGDFEALHNTSRYRQIEAVA